MKLSSRLRFNPFPASAFLALLLASPTTWSAEKIRFKTSAVPLASSEPTGLLKVPQSKKSSSEVEDFTEKKQTLEGEVRYTKAKLDNVQKQLAMQTAAGNLEAADRLIARAVSTETSEFFRQAHERRGTSVRLGAQLSHFVGEGDHVTGVQLADGEVIPADIVLVGIGVIARGELAEQLGLEVINGAIVVDEFARTSDHRVVAAGDAVLLPHPLGGGTQVRLESVQNAVDQSRIAAASLMGKSEPYHAVPWFWSDQADLKLQIAGLSTGYDQTVVRGNPDDEKFSVLYYRAGRLIAIDTVNDAPDYMAVRRALGDGQTIDPVTAADTSVKLKTLVIDA